jgi:hypothetical protein
MRHCHMNHRDTENTKISFESLPLCLLCLHGSDEIRQCQAKSLSKNFLRSPLDTSWRTGLKPVVFLDRLYLSEGL